MALKKVRDSYGDWVSVEPIQAKDLRRGDIIRMASDSLRIEDVPAFDKGRIKIVARSQKEAGGLVRRSYLASQVFDVERAAESVHHATKKSPAQLQREIDETLTGSFAYDRARKIVRLAANQVKNPSTKSWLLADERGTWEKRARDLLEKSAEKARELGMSEDQVNEEAANYLGYLALTASLKHAEKHSKK